MRMLQSQLFTKTRKEGPKDESSRNAELLIRAGFIHKEMAGVYSYLPLGLKVLKKIENIIREEMSALGGQEVLLTTLQDPKVWQKSERWDDEKVDNWFKTKLKNESELGVANTHEEPLTELLKNHLNSHKDLPLYIYQFQTKFRNELRAKSGILRGREFLMKDLYSFSRNEEEFKEFYERCAEAYLKVFKRVGIGEKTYRTVASGGAFTDGFTDEFQTITQSGEDVIYLDEEKKLAINKEVYSDQTVEKFGLNKEKLREEKTVEVGNIFPLGTRYSDALGLKFKDQEGKEQSVIMGSYGIGLGRLMGVITETLSDQKGLVWPVSVAPYQVHLLELSGGEEKVKEKAIEALGNLEKAGVEVLYDDRDIRAGEKFNDAELMGLPFRVVISKKGLEEDVAEIERRADGKTEKVSLAGLVEKIKENLDTEK